LCSIKINLCIINVKLCEKETRGGVKREGEEMGRDDGKEKERRGGREWDPVCIFKFSLE